MSSSCITFSQLDYQPGQNKAHIEVHFVKVAIWTEHDVHIVKARNLLRR